MLAGVALSLVAIAGGFAGGVHPVGDSLSAFRLPLCVGAWILAVASLSRVWILRAGAVLVPLTVVAAWPYLGGGGGTSEPALRLYQKNMLWNAQTRAALFADFRDSGADVLTLQEVNARNLDALTALADTFPHRHHCAFRFVGGTAVLSRRPFLQTLPCTDGMSAVQIATNNGPLWVIAVHVSWPFPYAQTDHVADLRAALRGLDGPVVLAGDFNMAPWGHAVGQLFAQLGVDRITPARGTYDLFGVIPLPLDHVHSTLPGNLVAVRPKLGADHRGVLVELGASS